MIEIHQGDCRELLPRLEAGAVQAIVTSPPYWGICEFGSIGGEPSIEEHVQGLVGVFREARRVLHRRGVLWLNYGDSYNHYAGNHGPGTSDRWRNRSAHLQEAPPAGSGLRDRELKAKDLLGMPWRVAMALQSDGWYLRADVIWRKSNAAPLNVNDRPHLLHEYVFLFSRSEQYEFYPEALGYRLTSVWDVDNRERCPDHPADFPVELARRCILTSTREGDRVLDPFFGAGTVGLAADRHDRDAVGIEISPEYVRVARERIKNDAPLFADVRTRGT